MSGAKCEVPPNKSLQVTFDPPPTFATAKACVASNAPELRRWAARQDHFQSLQYICQMSFPSMQVVGNLNGNLKRFFL